MATEIVLSPGIPVSPVAEPISQDKAATMTIKQILAQLDGVFPMDEAVIEGWNPCKHPKV